MNTKRFPIFYAPEGDATGSTAVLAADSSTGTQIDVTPRREMPPAEILQPAPIKPEPRVRQPGVKISKVDVAKELGLDEAPSVTIEREAKAARDKQGKFIKTPKDFRRPEQKETEDEPTPTLGEPTPTPTPASKAPEPEPVAPAKIKIGDEEKTADEWAAFHKELAAKAEKPTEPKPASQQPADTTAADESAAIQQRRTAWEKSARDAYAQFKPTQEQVDKALASGDPNELYEMFTLKPMLALEENMRKWSIATFGPNLEQLNGQLTPLATTQQQIAAYQAESSFLEQHPEIKGHKDGVETIRGLSADLHAEYDDLQQFIAARPSSPNLPKWQTRVKELENNFHDVLAREAKAKLNVAAPVASAPKPAVVAKPRPPAPGGNLGGAGSPKAVSSASAEIAELERRGYM